MVRRKNTPAILALNLGDAFAIRSVITDVLILVLPYASD
jgi:hypothetical protein